MGLIPSKSPISLTVMPSILSLSAKKSQYISVAGIDITRYNSVARISRGERAMKDLEDKRYGNEKVTSNDITGKRFGRLVALKLDHYHQRKNASRLQYWLCRCDCGNEVVVAKPSLGKATFSCGCLGKERRLTSKGNFKHGGKHTLLYEKWKGIFARCNNKNNISYKNYGGRGIKICPEWHDFASFRDWALANGYQDDLSIDRIDVNGNYEPLNCRWITIKEQSNNKRNNKFIDYNGERLTYTEWSRRLGHHSLVGERIKAGWDPIDAITIKPHCGPHKDRRK
jgi:hypothetical protein